MAKNQEPKKRITKEGMVNALAVFQYIKPYSFLFAIGMLLLVISGLLVIVITALLGMLVSASFEKLPGGGMTQWIVDHFNIGLNWGTTGMVLTALAGLLIIQGVFSFFRIYIFAYVTENAMLALRRDAYAKIIRMPMQFFNERRVGDLSSRLSNDITTIQETLTTTFAEFVRQIVIIVVGIGWLVSNSGKLTAVMLVTLPVIIIVMVFFGRYVRKLGKQTQDKVAESSVIVNESLTGIVNVKSCQRNCHEGGDLARLFWCLHHSVFIWCTRIGNGCWKTFARYRGFAARCFGAIRFCNRFGCRFDWWISSSNGYSTTQYRND
jgi:ABC-type multidrug transport system fused ATPase/permease subunit